MTSFAQTTSSIIYCDISKDLSQDFLKKMILCLQKESPNYWIVEYVMSGKTTLEIASRYLELSDYDGNFLTSSIDALFDAFIAFKDLRLIDSQQAAYLSNRSGGLGQYVNSMESDTINMIFFSVRDLIHELDGPDFESWLVEIGKNAWEEFNEEFEYYYEQLGNEHLGNEQFDN